MKKRYFLTAVLVALMIVPQVMAACHTDPRTLFKVKMSELVQCSFRSGQEQLTNETDLIDFMQIRNISGEFVCDKIVLAPDEEKTVKDLINRFDKNYYGFGNVHIEKQSVNAYERFIRTADSVNANQCDCKQYTNITRTGTLTSYFENENCNHDDSCRAIPPKGCMSRIFYDVTTNVILLLVIIIAIPLIVLTVLYQFFKL